MFLYIHIPFCASRCIYCDFYVVLDKHASRHGGAAAYVDALIREADMRFSNPAAPLMPIESIYIGGGTPSLLMAEDYCRIFDALAAYTPLNLSDAEITLEANPKNVGDTWQAYRKAGFNRVSVGIQSLNNPELKKLSRSHTAQEAVACIEDLKEAGFENISIDLMYGIPGQTQKSWQKTLEKAVSLDARHISMYGLKVEESTPMETLSKTETYTLPQDEVTVKMYFQALGYLEAVGYQRYEFSNLCRPGYESRHNLNYWNHEEFWALGASAHGYVNGVRYENVRDMETYLKNPMAGNATSVSEKEALENAIIFGLRKAEGIHLPTLEHRFGIDFRSRYNWILEKYRPMSFFILEPEALKLAVDAIPVSNVLLAEFIDA